MPEYIVEFTKAVGRRFEAKDAEEAIELAKQAEKPTDWGFQPAIRVIEIKED